MNGPRWDDEMKFELFRLRSELRTENFQVLATPLGLGRPRSETDRAEKPLYPPMRAALPLRSTQKVQTRQPIMPAALPRAELSQRDNRPVTPQRESALSAAMPADFPLSGQEQPLSSLGPVHALVQRPWLRWILVHLLDLGFVLVCLALGLVALGFILDPTHMSWTPDHLAQAVPLQVLRRLQSWMLGVGIYMIFAIYWLFFKFVSGATLGETCLPKFVAFEEQVAAAPDNSSGET